MDNPGCVSWDHAIRHEDYKNALSGATNLEDLFRKTFNANMFEQHGYEKFEHEMGTIYIKPVFGENMGKIYKLCKIAIVSLFLILSSGFAHGGCLQDAGLLRSSLNCVGMPTIPKFFDPGTFAWGAKQILAINDGNELQYWDISNPLNPIVRGTSNFNVANQGDSDYDLMTYSICDNCRYGVAVFKLGIVIWDQGTGVNPTFGQRYFYPIGKDPRGSFSFKRGDDQFIVAKYLPGDKYGTTGTIYKVTGVNNLLNVGNIYTPGTKIVGGVRVGNTVYLGMMDNWLYTFCVTSSESPLSYVGRSPIRAFLGRGKGFSVSGNIGVSAFLDGAKVWDLNIPESPFLVTTIPGSYQYAAMGGLYIWITGGNNIPGTFRFFGVDPAVQIEPLDQEFWNPDNPWNDYGTTCEFPTGAVFSPDGRMLYMSRYAVVQKVNFSACMGAPPTPTPTPPPWPTPRPTCVPGCVSVN